jgi:hypothetical protein
MIAKKTPKKKWLLKKAPAKKAVAKTNSEETSSKKKTCSKKKEIKWSLIFEPINTETLELIHGLTLSSWGAKLFFIRKSNLI